MPEQEGYIGIINLLTKALDLLVEGEGKDLVKQARAETIRQARQSMTSLEIGLDLGRLLGEAENMK